MREIIPTERRGRGLAKEQITDIARAQSPQRQDSADDSGKAWFIAGVDQPEMNETSVIGQIVALEADFHEGAKL
jgi:hypothetical protein